MLTIARFDKPFSGSVPPGSHEAKWRLGSVRGGIKWRVSESIEYYGWNTYRSENYPCDATRRRMHVGVAAAR